MKNLKRKISCVLILSLLVTTSYSKVKNEYKLVEKQNLKNVFFINSHAFFEGYYYQGSDEKFHYFISKWKIQKDRKFKLRVKDIHIKKTFDFKQNEVRISSLKLDKKPKFDENEYFKLYIIK